MAGTSRSSFFTVRLGVCGDLCGKRGLNNLGQPGNGSTIDSDVPVAVKGVGGVGVLNGIVAISAGY